jgi:hypothetical protein
MSTRGTVKRDRPPTERAIPGPYSSHRLLEARSLAMHAVIARKVDRDPKLLAIPRRNLNRWRARWPDEPPAWHSEWRALLRRPWPEIAAVITEQSENAARLRQSSPFAGVLTRDERDRIYEAFRVRDRFSEASLTPAEDSGKGPEQIKAGTRGAQHD